MSAALGHRARKHRTMPSVPNENEPAIYTIIDSARRGMVDASPIVLTWLPLRSLLLCFWQAIRVSLAVLSAISERLLLCFREAIGVSQRHYG